MARNFAAIRNAQRANERRKREAVGSVGNAGPDGGTDASDGGSDASLAIDPEAAIASGSDGTGSGEAEPVKRRRGRPPGSKNKSGGNGQSSNSRVLTGGIEQTLLSVHMMAAAYFRAPHWQLEEQEAKNLAKAIDAVQAHYDIPGLNEEHACLLALAISIGTVYGPRVIISMRGKDKAKAGQAASEQRAREGQPQSAAPSATSPDMGPSVVQPGGTVPSFVPAFLRH